MMMNVTRIHTDHGSHIEPPCEDGWDDLTKLQWHAAVVAHDTGLRVAVGDGALSTKRYGRWVPVPGQFNVQVAASSSGPFTFETAWAYLSGVSVGSRSAFEGLLR